MESIVTSNKVLDYYNQCHIDYEIAWRLNKTFSIHYGFYDQDHRDHDSAVANMNRVMAQMAEITAADRVLDAGCGVGGSSVWLAQNLDANVVGINLSARQIEIAQHLAASKGVSGKVEFSVRSFTETRFPDGSFDVVWGLESTCYAEHKELFVAEAARVLKPGGRIIVADGFLNRTAISKREQLHLNAWLDGWAVPNLAGVSDFQSYLDKQGFTNVKFVDVTPNVLPSSKRMFKASVLYYPLSKFFEWRGARTTMQARNLSAAYHQYLALKQGSWLYGIFCAQKKKSTNDLPLFS
jgi:tocopherol O-methyltransferase